MWIEAIDIERHNPGRQIGRHGRAQDNAVHFCKPVFQYPGKLMRSLRDAPAPNVSMEFERFWKGPLVLEGLEASGAHPLPIVLSRRLFCFL